MLKDGGWKIPYSSNGLYKKAVSDLLRVFCENDDTNNIYKVLNDLIMNGAKIEQTNDFTINESQAREDYVVQSVNKTLKTNENGLLIFGSAHEDSFMRKFKEIDDCKLYLYPTKHEIDLDFDGRKINLKTKIINR